jgi:hypothetical protein
MNGLIISTILLARLSVPADFDVPERFMDCHPQPVAWSGVGEMAKP